MASYIKGSLSSRLSLAARATKLVLVATASLSFGSMTRAGEVDHTLFGLELGKPVALQACPVHTSEPLRNHCKLPRDIAEPCACMESPTAPRLEFPAGKAPKVLNEGYFPQVTIIDGNVEAVEFKTYGVTGEEVTFGLLVTKYGKPTLVNTGTARNLAGAEFPTRTVRWKFDDLLVTYYSVDKEMKTGTVIVQTDKAVAVSSIKQKQADDSRAKF